VRKSEKVAKVLGITVAFLSSMRIPFFKSRASPVLQRFSNAVTVGQLLTKVRETASHTRNSEFVIDLTEVQEISSQELDALVRLHLSVRENEGRIVLANASEKVAETLYLTRMDRTVEVRAREVAV
jgi:anti-anti-sigma factor